MDRDGLGKLWLRWFVHRSDPRRPFSRIELSTVDAQQLRVCDVVNDVRAWQAMSEPDPNRSGMSHAKTIREYEDRYRDAEVAVFVSAAHPVREGLVLLAGMHRACALYRLAPAKLDVTVIEFPPDPADPNVQPGPRSTTL